MNFTLTTKSQKTSLWVSLAGLWPLLRTEQRTLVVALGATFCTAALNLLGPLLFGLAIDQYIAQGNYGGALQLAGLLLVIFVGALFAGYVQTTRMGSIGQRTLYRLRQDLFAKIQSLPIAFFHQNASGDLISRINNDTEKLNMFFSQSLVQFFGNIFIMTGAAVCMLWLHWDLALLALAPALVVLIVTKILSPWVRRTNQESLASTGNLSSEIQEGLGNFKAIVAFHRREYFREHFHAVNQEAYRASLGAGIANQVYAPLYTLAYHVSQVFILLYGLAQMQSGTLTVGMLISFFAFANRFFEPFRFLGQLWASFQSALAAWERVDSILQMEGELPLLPAQTPQTEGPLLQVQSVSFGYKEDTQILHDINLRLDRGKTYALVGPTGGGKTTLASLLARLYDPSAGTISFEGRDLRTLPMDERTRKIGFILQDPFLFSGSLWKNIVFGHPTLMDATEEDLLEKMRGMALDPLVEKFPKGLHTRIDRGGDGLSLGQKQLVAFLRAVLRTPDLLLLDEATANVDTVTEQLLGEILTRLPAHTTTVIIAHRLSTIEKADEIFFINGGTLTTAASLRDAVALLTKEKRQS